MTMWRDLAWGVAGFALPGVALVYVVIGLSAKDQALRECATRAAAQERGILDLHDRIADLGVAIEREHLRSQRLEAALTAERIRRARVDMQLAKLRLGLREGKPR